MMSLKEDELQLGIDAALRSKTFAKSAASRALLQFLSHKNSSGLDVSSATIATEFLKLPPADASPKNAIVRVQVSRLRDLLEKYYNSEGASSSYQVAIPVGSFALALKPGVADQSNFAPTISLLEISNIGGDTFQEQYCAGLRSELAHLLSKTREVRLFLRDAAKASPSKNKPMAPSGSAISHFLLHGTVRTIPESYRVLLYLADGQTEQIIWSKEYVVSRDAKNAFATQTEIAGYVTSLLISHGGIIDKYLRRKPSDGSPHAAVLQFYEYLENYSPQTLQLAKQLLLKAVAEVPLYSEAWASLAGVYCNEYMFGALGSSESMDLSLHAARRSLQICPDSTMGLYALALAYYYKGERNLFFEYAEKAVTQGSHRVDVLATIGLHVAYAGHWEAGISYLERAKQLNPHHPSWYFFPQAANCYRLHQYEDALNAAMKLNMPQFEWEALFFAAIHGQLGHPEIAGEYLETARKIKPEVFDDLSAYVARVFKDGAFHQHFMDGLRKGQDWCGAGA